MSDETAPQPKAKISWYLGTLLAFLIFAVIAAYASRITNNFPDDDAQRAADRYDNLKKTRATEDALLNPVAEGKPTAEWVDQNKGLIRVPIDQAMAVVVNDLQAKAPAAANEIPAPAAPAPAAPAASTNATNAPAAAAPTPATTNAPAASAPATTNAPAARAPAGKNQKGAKH